MTRPINILSLLFLALGTLYLTAPVFAKDKSVNIKTIEAGPGVYMLVGQGGNIGLSVGEDGVFMIDDQFAPLSEKILAAISELSDLPVEFLINTHWHWDHTGGNENLSNEGAVIVAHENVRKRLSTEQFIKAFNKKVEPSPPAALPVITFTKEVKFHLNDNDIRVFHVANAHTDGDSIVHFPESNVLHMGDVFFNEMYPFIDLSSGGSIDGMIAGVHTALSIAGPETRIIPGHGTMTDRAGLEAYLKMLEDICGEVSAMIDAGKGLEAIKSARPSKEFDKKWGGGFVKPDAFVEIVYKSLIGDS